MNGDIYRYRVAKDISTSPRIGRSKTYKTFENKEEAIKYAKQLAGDLTKEHAYFVEERRYIGERNLERDFCLTARIIWSYWWS